MERYNTIIIDDEQQVRQALERMVERYCPDIIVVGTAESSEKGRQLLKTQNVQLIFLDISMPVEDGFDFINSITKENYAIIFTTAYEEYAIKAIKANAIDYLLKPISFIELQDAVLKAISYLNFRKQKTNAQKIYSQSLNNLSEQIKLGLSSINKITIVEQFGFHIVNVEDIQYLEADGNYTIFHISGLKKMVSSKALGEYEKILDFPMFFRIHKSTIINMAYLKAFSSFEGFNAILLDQTKLSISKRRVCEFKEIVKFFSKSIE